MFLFLKKIVKHITKSLGIVQAVQFLDNCIFDNIGPIKILFVVKNGYGYQCLIPIIEKCLEDKTFSVRLTLEQEGCFQFPLDSLSKRLEASHFITPLRAKIGKWHYVFISDVSHVHPLRSTTIVNTQHAISYGNTAYRNNSPLKENYTDQTIAREGITLSFINSPARLPIYQKDRRFINEKKQVLVTGFAKMDPLVNNNYTAKDKFNFLRELKVDHEKKVIVLYSHWTDKSLFNTLGSSLACFLCKHFHEYNILVLGHELLWREHDGSDRKNPLFQELQLLGNRYDNCTFLPFITNLYMLQYSTDLVIGDYSSLFVEYCLVDKPILFFDSGLFFDNPFVYDLYKDASFTFAQLEELKTLIPRAMGNPSYHREERKRLVEHFLYRPGHAGEYITHSLRKMGRVSGPNSRNWKRVVDYCESECRKFS